MNQYLFYWRWDTVQTGMGEAPPVIVDHVAGQQLRKVRPGDVLWVITMQQRSQRLILCARITVGWIGSRDDVAEHLGISPNDLWDSDWHVLADPEKLEPLDIVDITAIAGDLRFQSSGGRDRLSTDSFGIAAPQQLRTMRKLTPESSALLSRIWYAAIDEEQSADTADPGLTAYEGRIRSRLHRVYERNAALVTAAKERFMLHNGRLFCEVCGFDFQQCYGDIGNGYIEAHHIEPISQRGPGGRLTKTDDLSLVCSNCHRMLHRHGMSLTLEELRSMIALRK